MSKVCIVPPTRTCTVLWGDSSALENAVRSGGETPAARTELIHAALGSAAPLKLAPRVIPHTARSPGSESSGGMARSLTQSQ